MVWDGKLESLKRFKDDVREVKAGIECGIKIAGYDDVKVDDVIEVFRMERVAASACRRPGRTPMAVVLLVIDVHLPFAQSLKDKRMILRGVKDRTKKFNVSVAEVEHHDLWQRATLPVVTVATDGVHAEKELQAVVSEIERHGPGLDHPDGDRTPGVTPGLWSRSLVPGPRSLFPSRIALCP